MPFLTAVDVRATVDRKSRIGILGVAVAVHKRNQQRPVAGQMEGRRNLVGCLRFRPVGAPRGRAEPWRIERMQTKRTRDLRGRSFAGWTLLLVATATAVGLAAGPVTRPPGRYPPVGGANAPRPTGPPALVIKTDVLETAAFAVRVPVGTYIAPAGGAPNYTVPGPIVAFKGPDDVWRGHGYLETYPRLLKFEGRVAGGAASLVYTFEQDKYYKVRLESKGGALLLEEESDLGPRNLYVFDGYYGDWLPSAGFAVDTGAVHHAFLYLPCHYDQPEVTIRPAELGKGALPAGVAVLSPDAGKDDVAGFWCCDVESWTNADRMGITLWQRRQRPGEPGSRHFLGPETKSDSTPNPRTAGLIGQSLYEGHVTIEFALGTGTRRLGFAVTGKGHTRQAVPEALKAMMRRHP